MKDWTGNKKSIFTTIGASNHVDRERQEHDYYATSPIAVEKLLEVESFSHDVWECACGGGHISKVLERNGHDVFSTDKYFYGYEGQGLPPVDFLTDKITGIENCDIITNPPYKYALEFCRKAIDTITEGHKVAMLLKLTFLEGQKRLKFFRENPPARIWVFSSRVKCAMNGDFDSIGSSAMCYAWFIWKKNYKGKPVIDWIE